MFGRSCFNKILRKYFTVDRSLVNLFKEGIEIFFSAQNWNLKKNKKKKTFCQCLD